MKFSGNVKQNNLKSFSNHLSIFKPKPFSNQNHFQIKTIFKSKPFSNQNHFQIKTIFIPKEPFRKASKGWLNALTGEQCNFQLLEIFHGLIPKAFYDNEHQVGEEHLRRITKSQTKKAALFEIVSNSLKRFEMFFRAFDEFPSLRNLAVLLFEKTLKEKKELPINEQNHMENAFPEECRKKPELHDSYLFVFDYETLAEELREDK